MKFLTKKIIGNHVILEQYTPDHAEGLSKTGNHKLLKYTYGPQEWTKDGITSYIQKFIQSDSRVPFVIKDAKSDNVIGFSAFININKSDLCLEIGPTWITPEYQGTLVNIETKFLMLQQVFEIEGIERVEFYCDGENKAAYRSLEKIGAIFEGKKRHHTRRVDGSFRDTMIFSILKTDWPLVKNALHQKLQPQDYQISVDELHIRPSRATDLMEIWNIEKSAFGIGYSYGHLHQFFELYGDLILVAETSTSELVGYVLAGISTLYFQRAWILNIGVKKEFQNKGVGKTLMNAVLPELNRRQIKEVLLTVHPKNSNAVHLYKQLGFDISQHDENYYGPNTPRYVMTYKFT